MVGGKIVRVHSIPCMLCVFDFSALVVWNISAHPFLLFAPRQYRERMGNHIYNGVSIVYTTWVWLSIAWSRCRVAIGLLR